MQRHHSKVHTGRMDGTHSIEVGACILAHTWRAPRGVVHGCGLLVENCVQLMWDVANDSHEPRIRLTLPRFKWHFPQYAAQYFKDGCILKCSEVGNNYCRRDGQRNLNVPCHAVELNS